MRLGDFILEEAIISDLRAETKPEALSEIVRSVVQSGCIEADAADSVLEALLHREEIGSTGIGLGVAIAVVVMAGVAIGARIAHAVSAGTLARAVAVVLILTGLYMAARIVWP